MIEASDSDMAGAPGTVHFNFEGVAQFDKCQIYFDLARSWENESIGKKTLTVLMEGTFENAMKLMAV